MTRHNTTIQDGTVYVGREPDWVEVGELDRIIEFIGGPAWTIEYDEAEKERHPEMDTSDEGLTVDVVDMMHAMTHGDAFVDTLRTHPADVPSDSEAVISPRLGLFVGKLLANLENGVD